MLDWEQFNADKHGAVQGFHCGDEPWSVEVNNFVKDDNGDSQAIKLIRSGRAEMWLYRQQSDGLLVGFGALSKPKWTIDDKPEKVTVIHAFGITKAFHGFPPGPPEQRYASLILSDLLSKAVAYGRPLCGLLVHKENARAKRFYEREGFELIEEVRDTHDRMLLRLQIEQSLSTAPVSVPPLAPP